MTGEFITGETVEGKDSNDTNISGIINDSEGSIVKGSKVITDRYDLISGQLISFMVFLELFVEVASQHQSEK